MVRPGVAAFGFCAFVVAHLTVVWGWTAMHGTGEPWFLNSGTAAATTVAAMFAAGAAAEALWGSRRWVDVPVSVSAGAIAGLAATMAVVVRGTLFPIVFAIGAAVTAASAAAGCLAIRLVLRGKRGWNQEA